MGIPLRALLVEDSEDDAFLVLRELQRGGFNIIHERVDTAEDMLAALNTQFWDIVFADYSMPHFNGLEALALLQQRQRPEPLILISGTIGEEVAVEAMKAGAQDYLLKGNLTRLIPAVQRTLRETQEHRARQQAEMALKASEERFHRFAENAQDILYIYRVAEPRGLEYISPAIYHITGYTPEEFYQDPDLGAKIVHPEDLELLAKISRGADGWRIQEVLRIVGLDPNDRRPVRLYSNGMRKRLGIAQAILEKPQVLILDEPTDAIDQAGWKDVYEYLIQLKEDGTTILFSSNNLDEIAILCDQAFVLKDKQLKPVTV